MVFLILLLNNKGLVGKFKNTLAQNIITSTIVDLGQGHQPSAGPDSGIADSKFFWAQPGRWAI
jgi:hypothetical protein